MASFSTSAASQGAAQGAAAGASFGPWGAVIGAGVGLVSGGLEGGILEDATRKLTRANNRIIEQRRQLQDERNKLLIKETARATGELLKQQQYESINISRAIQHINRGATTAKADIAVQNAVADRIGASAAAVYTAVDAEADAQISNAMLSLEVSQDNTRTEVQSVLQRSLSMVDTTVHTNVINQPTYSTTSTLLGLVQAGGELYKSGAFDKLGGSTTTNAGVTPTT